MTMKIAIIRVFQNQAGSTSPTPISVERAPRVVAFVPACNLLYISGIRRMPSEPRKRNKTPVVIRI
jgi:hypothetical protein